MLPGEAIVLRADTGMLGAPEINDKGIAVKCLMNPALRVNGAIKLDNNGIKAKRVKAQALATKREKQETNWGERTSRWSGSIRTASTRC